MFELQRILFLIVAEVTLARYFIIGPAQVTLTHHRNCPEYSNMPLKLDIKTRMFNKTTQLLDGMLIVPMEINDDITMAMKATRVGKHKLNSQVNSFTIDNTPACQALNRYLGEFFRDLQKQLGLKPGSCPIPKGNYSVNNLFLDLNKLGVEMLLDGTFKTRVLLKNSTRPIYCADYEVVLEPRV